MPFTSEETISKLEEKLSGLSSVTSLLDQGMTPEDMLQELLGELGLEITDRIPVEYRCGCSRERIEKALVSIGKKELKEMIAEGKTIEVNCQFCGKSYSVTVEELKELLRRAVRK